MDLVFDARWRLLMKRMEDRFGMPMDLDSLLFLIGVQELGQPVRDFGKDDKIGLMHIAVSTLLALYGYYAPAGRDEDGWPHFERAMELPPMSSDEQEQLLKEAALLYFESH